MVLAPVLSAFSVFGKSRVVVQRSTQRGQDRLVVVGPVVVRRRHDCSGRCVSDSGFFFGFGARWSSITKRSALSANANFGSAMLRISSPVFLVNVTLIRFMEI